MFHILIVLTIWGFFITLALFLFQVVFGILGGIIALVVGGMAMLFEKIFSKNDKDDWTV